MNGKTEYVKAYKNNQLIHNKVIFFTKEKEKAQALLASNLHFIGKSISYLQDITTKEAAIALAEAEWILSTIELPTYFIKKENQNYLQILPEETLNANQIRLLLHADFIMQENAPQSLAQIKPILTADFISVKDWAQYVFTKTPIQQKVKKNIVMYCGGFKKNGVTTSALNLMHNLDKEKYQLIVIEEDNLGYYEQKNFDKIPANVVKVQIPGDCNIFPEETAAFTQFHEEPLPHLIKNGKANFLTADIKAIYQRELKRILGPTKIDIALDFDGYFKYWTLLFAASQDSKKIIFQHNEMMHEYSKKTAGNYKHRDDLNIIFPLYNYFDHVVSVAEHTGDVNKDFLKHLVKDTSKMTYVHNSIDYKRILEASDEENGVQLPADTFNFVTMGRLAPEKNQKMMIDAFYQLQEKYSATSLYIIGSGELEAELTEYVADPRLQGKVHLLGQLDNPFPTIKAADAFVLSSVHEGQPMVLLESLVLDTNILSTNIPGCYSILKDGYGLLVDNDTTGLVNGMEKMYTHEFKQKRFDYKKYNEEAIEMIENMLDDVSIAQISKIDIEI
ncbi:glycosyltransferase [Listeria grayi]|uniref:Glycosyltransferase, group 1 family protein n=1 Tax=Listeria grayi DSM 20601 TaxID=525367 RepID=D7UZE6_LISGR|nr:glycosyltransferase [Listeria grayi]EFI83711.1 glycosyltransferase, group 1 family protein [Listeria grayi DSM 20601]